MASYLRSFWSSTPAASTSSTVEPLRISPPLIVEEEVEDQEPDEQEDEDDRPPSFPAPNSIQRSRPDSELMPPPSVGGLSGGLSLPPSTTTKPKPRSRKVALAPGHSPLDWARLKASGTDLRVLVPSSCHRMI